MEINRESIWAAGCPQNVKEEFKMKFQDHLIMGLEFIIKHFAKGHGYEVKNANAQPNVLPNLILERNGVLYGVAVTPFVFPNFAIVPTNVRIQFVNNMKKHNMVPLFAPIGFKSEDPERAKAQMMLKGDTFNILFRGFLVMTDDENQNLMAEPSEFKKVFD